MKMIQMEVFRRNGNLIAAAFSCCMILFYLLFHFVLGHRDIELYPLTATLLLVGLPLLFLQAKKILNRDMGSDVLAGISILACLFLKEYLAGAVVVFMLSGGKALEDFAMQNASSVLGALAKRMPRVAHRRQGSKIQEIKVEEIKIADTLTVFPFEVCPVDGEVLEGHGRMNEAYLTGEPFQIDKAPGSSVISGAVNGDSPLTIKAIKLPTDSRYARIMEVMRVSEKNKPHIRRLADRVAFFYVPQALVLASLAWVISGEPTRFLAVLVVATPCPLLIGIPIAIIGSISLCAKRGIIVRNPQTLEEIDLCRTAIFDKTGTLTYGEPELSDVVCAPAFSREKILGLAASLERYSKHPLALALTAAAKKEKIPLNEALEIREIAGEGLRGSVDGRKLRMVGRKQLAQSSISGLENLPSESEGLECVLLVDEVWAALFRFRDTPRAEGFSFIGHLGPRHQLNRAIIISGDREGEVRYLAKKVGISEVYAGKSPEEKLALVKAETSKAKTLFVGDGINDAPALMAASVGVAIGRNNEITSQSAGAVVLDSNLRKVDELMHIGRRMRGIAIQCAVGGMLLSVVGMFFAAWGHLSPVMGAVTQEGIDLLAILNALRAALPPKELSDF